MRLTALGGGIFVAGQIEKDWVQYRGERHGEGWKSTTTGEIRYQVVLADANVEKSLSPRNIPPEDAISGLRASEEQFTATLYGLIREGMKAVLSASTESAAILYARQAMDRFSELAEAAALAHIDDVYTALIKEAQGEFPHARFEDHDYRAKQLLENLPTGLIPALRGLSDELTLQIEDVVRRNFQAGTDRLRKALEQIAPIGEKRLELIARTETTRVANLGRATQLLKYIGPDTKVDWVLARHPHGDFRTCEVCKAIANGGTVEINRVVKTFHGNPYDIVELESLVAHLVAHPNERCVVSRRVEKSGAARYEIRLEAI